MKKKKPSYSPVSSNSSNSNNSNSNSNSDRQNSEENQQFLDCPFCDKRVYSEEECEKHKQDTDCGRQSKIMEPIGEKIENDESILDIKVDELEISPKMKKLLKIVQRIQKGEKVDINSLDISERAKEILRKRKRIGTTPIPFNNHDYNYRAEPKRPFYKSLLFIIGIVVILVVTLVLIIIKTRSKKRKVK